MMWAAPGGPFQLCLGQTGVPVCVGGGQQASSLRVPRSPMGDSHQARAMAGRGAALPRVPGRTDGRLGPTCGAEEQRGERGTKSTLQNRCFVPAHPCHRASSPEWLWPFAKRGLLLWGCQSASLQEGPPRLPIHWRSEAGGLSPPNWAGEEGAAWDCPPHRASRAPCLQSMGIGDPLIPPGSWVQVGGLHLCPLSTGRVGGPGFWG